MNTSESNGSTVQRGIELEGADAVAWLFRRGFFTTSRSTLRLVGDSIVTERLRLARLWHTAGTLEHPRADAGVELVVVLDGHIVVRDGGGEVTVGRHNAIVLSSAREYSITSTKPSARLEIGLDRGFAARHVALTGGFGTVLPPSAYISALISVVNTFLGSEGGMDGQAGVSLRQAVESFVVAVIKETQDAVRDLTVPEALMYRRAMAAIDDGSAAIEFTVAALAAELGISVRHLQRVFAVEGTTPTWEIRWARARHAEALLDTAGGHPEEIAAVTGFRTARTMRRAIRDLDQRDRPPPSIGADLHELESRRRSA